jgi:hypothetical protein
MDFGRGGRPTRRAMKVSLDPLGQIEAEPSSCPTSVDRRRAESRATFTPWIPPHARWPNRDPKGRNVSDAGPRPRTSAV